MPRNTRPGARRLIDAMECAVTGARRVGAIATPVPSLMRDVFAAEHGPLSGKGDFRDDLKGVLERWKVSADVGEVLDIWTLVQPIEEANYPLVRKPYTTRQIAGVVKQLLASRAEVPEA